MGASATFIEGGRGNILVVVHEPEQASGRGIIVLPAFAEEMNKSRRLVWETGQLLAEAGHTVLVPDLHGTGDSEGDFANATWNVWIDDLRNTLAWARQRGIVQFNALAVRLGAAFLCDKSLMSDVEFERAVAWHPIRKGEDVLRQQLRMKIMALRMSGEKAEPLESMRAAFLKNTEPLQLAGYVVSPRLANDVESATFSESSYAPTESGLIIEKSSIVVGDELNLSETSGDSVWQWSNLNGEKFWQSVDPSPNPWLVNETAQFLRH